MGASFAPCEWTCGNGPVFFETHGISREFVPGCHPPFLGKTWLAGAKIMESGWKMMLKSVSHHQSLRILFDLWLLILWMSWDVPFCPCLPDVVGRLSPTCVGLAAAEFFGRLKQRRASGRFLGKVAANSMTFFKNPKPPRDIHLENLAEALRRRCPKKTYVD